MEGETLISDLDTLESSDTECFVEVDASPTETLICEKCQKLYKRQKYFVKHVASCTGVKRRGPVTSPSEKTTNEADKRKYMYLIIFSKMKI